MNVLQLQIEEVIRKTGSDINLILPAIVHLYNVRNTFVDDLKFKTRREYIDALLAKFFITNLNRIYPNERFTCKLDDNFDWPIPLYPSESFVNENGLDAYRIKVFFELLKVADVLDCKVIDKQPTVLSLIVVHKYGYTRKLEDMNITVSLSLNKREVAFLAGDIPAKLDFVRVAVSEVRECITQNVVKVTLDKGILQVPNHKVKLGKIRESELPVYITNPTGYGSCKNLKEYLDSQIGFKNPKSFNNILSGFGLNPTKIYSFIEIFDRLNNETHSVELEQITVMLQEYKEKKRVEQVKRHYEKGLKFFEESLYSEALNEANQAIKLDPNCSNAYILRAEISGKTGKNMFSGKALEDYCKAFVLDKNNPHLQERIAKAFYVSASKCCHLKKFEKAYICVTKCLHHVPNYENALKLKTFLEKHHPEVVPKGEHPKQTENLIPIHKIKQEPA